MRGIFFPVASDARPALALFVNECSDFRNSSKQPGLRRTMAAQICSAEKPALSAAETPAPTHLPVSAVWVPHVAHQFALPLPGSAIHSTQHTHGGGGGDLGSARGARVLRSSARAAPTRSAPAC